MTFLASKQEVEFKQFFPHEIINQDLQYFQHKIALEKDISAGQLLWKEYLRRKEIKLAIIYLIATAILDDDFSKTTLIKKVAVEYSHQDDIIELAVTHLTCYANEGYDSALDILRSLIIGVDSMKLAKKIAFLYVKSGGNLKQHRLFLEEILSLHYSPEVA